MARKFFGRHGGTFLIIAGVILLYELLTDCVKVLDPMFFPGFSKILPKMGVSAPLFFKSIVSSMKLLIPGYFSALLVGVILGTIIGLHPLLNKNLKPIIFALAPLPPSMLTPYLIAILPTFYLSSVAVIFIGCFWPVLVGTISGMVLIDQGYLDNAAIMGLSAFKRLFHVLLPAASPHILAGASTALNFSFILLVIAEMFATNSGMGYFVQYYADFSDYSRVLGGLIGTSIVVVIIKYIFEAVKHRLLFWCLNSNARME